MLFDCFITRLRSISLPLVLIINYEINITGRASSVFLGVYTDALTLMALRLTAVSLQGNFHLMSVAQDKAG